MQPPMQRIVPGLLLSAVVVGTVSMAPMATNFAPIPISAVAQAQVNPQGDLYYTFYGQRIPLVQRQDRIAVQLAPSVDGSRDAVSAYQQLEWALKGHSDGSRGGAVSAPALPVTLRPLGSRYAIIELPAVDAELATAIAARLQQPYVEAILPVLSQAEGDDTILLPNQIIISFEPDTPQSQVQLTLNRYGLELIRPLQFTRNRYLVSSRDGGGLQILDLANRLASDTGIQSATPNFVQTVSYRTVPQSLDSSATAPQRSDIDSLLTRVVSPRDWPVASDLFPLHWHLDSTPLRGIHQPRTDVQAVQAWEQGTQGAGVVVAVIDSLIQWDHPDLINSLYTVPENQANRLPNETHGWDFSNREATCTETVCTVGDSDTRISNAEMDLMRPALQETFLLSDEALLEQYKDLADWILEKSPELSQHQIASIIRNWVRSSIMAEFHGTWSSGVVAANPTGNRGIIGVAPEAKILPVRVFGLGGEITIASLIEAVGYAADRGADVINLSLGSLLPSHELTDQILAVLDANSNLVIVASAGNESLDGVGFPAAIPGVISVGATTLEGRRTFYSSYGGGLDVVAPGGDTRQVGLFGILTTGGTWVPDFWQGMEPPTTSWGYGLDSVGTFVQVQGTSFSAPVTAGVAALVLAANPNLNRAQVTDILTSTASYEGLGLTQADANQYRLQAELGMGTVLYNQIQRPSGIFNFPPPISPEQYYFGQGLVNAAAAVEKAKAMQ